MSSEVQVLLVLLAAVFTLSSAFPQKSGNVDKTIQEASGGLPFLQFTNGGVRVNFGGYHAEAGLGGLLGGARTGGGLHASAGTPDGAHASAGLGGLLGGDNANAGGGLHARAGLGNGGPEAKAGLGGTLDGSSRRVRAGPRAQGTLFADATLGNAEKEENGRKNIQVIPRPSKDKAVAESLSSKGTSANSDAGASASADVGTLTALQKEKEYHDANAGHGISIHKTKTLEKTLAPAEPPASSDGQGGNTEFGSRGIYPARWYRKRLRAGARKNVLFNTVLLPEGDAQVAPSSPGIFARAGSEINYSNSEGQKGSTLFDDIFNIPISTLNAVNQLLKNKVG